VCVCVVYRESLLQSSVLVDGFYLLNAVVNTGGWILFTESSSSASYYTVCGVDRSGKVVVNKE
jgi:hypothetical protein